MLITVKQAAERTDLSESQIRRMIREGLIAAKKIGTIYVMDSRVVRRLKRRRDHKCTEKDWSDGG